MPRVTRIDVAAMRDLTAEFPDHRWERVPCQSLHNPSEKDPLRRNWQILNHLRETGGNYAFLLPARLFATERVIKLDGPNKRKIPFRFSTRTHEPIGDQLVVYVGKAANLLQRFQWHFGLAEVNTGAQVQYGLKKSGLCPNRRSAVEFMLEQATIVCRVLSGDENAGNRDLLELSLCARFAPPFNIKSER